jgi:hypothetical protein
MASKPWLWIAAACFLAWVVFVVLIPILLSESGHRPARLNMRRWLERLLTSACAREECP